MAQDIRDILDRTRDLAGLLRHATTRAVRSWVEDCSGMTMRHVDLFQSQREIDWALENLQRVKAAVDAACVEASAALTKDQAA